MLAYRYELLPCSWRNLYIQSKGLGFRVQGGGHSLGDLGFRVYKEGSPISKLGFTQGYIWL